MKYRLMALCLCAALTLAGCGAPAPVTESAPPAPMRDTPAELRGVWVSYIELDGLLTDADEATARQRLDEVMDTCAARGLGAVFFHVRAFGDAYYPSAVYPPAAAAAPLLAAGFDPLAYALEAAHSRGLTLHAWVNPYRIGRKAPADTAHTFQQDGVYYYDPGSTEARRLVLAGIRELLAGYAVDGIHFDDYFYPAGLDGEQAEPFETPPPAVAVGDWRRQQVNGLVSAVWSLCHQAGRVFGVSPAARPAACRETAYADVALWLRQRGYVDYLCPQIYYGFTHATAPFEAVLAQWTALPRHSEAALYVGLALYKAGLTDDPYAGDGRGEWATGRDILARQLTAARRSGQVTGFVLFRYGNITQGGAAAEELQALQALL